MPRFWVQWLRFKVVQVASRLSEWPWKCVVPWHAGTGLLLKELHQTEVLVAPGRKVRSFCLQGLFTWICFSSDCKWCPCPPLLTLTLPFWSWFIPRPGVCVAVRHSFQWRFLFLVCLGGQMFPTNRKDVGLQRALYVFKDVGVFDGAYAWRLSLFWIKSLTLASRFHKSRHIASWGDVPRSPLRAALNKAESAPGGSRFIRRNTAE